MAKQSDADDGCIACGWTSFQQSRCHYSSHVKLFYGASERGAWAIGSDVILKDRPDEGPKARIEAKALEFLAKRAAADNINIPAPKLIRDWVDRDGRYFTLTERIHGQTLEETWPTLSATQKITIADQVVQVRTQLRSHFTSTIMQKRRRSKLLLSKFVVSGYGAPRSIPL